MQMKEMEEKLNSEETKADEYKNQVDDLSWEVSKLTSTQDKLESHIHDITDKNKRLQQLCEVEDKRDCDLPVRKLDVSDVEVLDLRKENEELRELAGNRLQELERLHQTQKDTLEELARLRMDVRRIGYILPI
jgi:chromosome segregation ATPase